jgi:hypothetical protein
MIKPEDFINGSETGEQKAVFAWAGLNQHLYPQLKWLHAIPNANSHRMVAEGVRGGVSDIFLPWPKWIYGLPSQDNPTGKHLISVSGLYIEMKTEKRRKQKNGGLSEDQIDFIDYAREAGYKCEVCYSWIEARDAILGYLNGN